MGRGRAAAPSSPIPVVLDSGALIALSRGSARARRLLERALLRGSRIVIPSVVVAETVRGDGPRDAPVNRVLKEADSVASIDEDIARAAGALLGAARSKATIDALVVSIAAQMRPAIVLTGDLSDVGRLARRVPGVSVMAV